MIQKYTEYTKTNEEFVSFLKNLFANLFKKAQDEFKKLLSDGELNLSELKEFFTYTINTSIDSSINNIKNIKSDQELNLDTLWNDRIMASFNDKQMIDTVKKSIGNNVKDTEKAAKYIKAYETGLSMINKYVLKDQNVKKKFYDDPVAKNVTPKTKIDEKKTGLVNILNGLKKALIDDLNAIPEKEWKNIEEYLSGGGDFQYKEGDSVRYKKEDFVDGKPPEEQQDAVAQGLIKKIEGDVVTIYNDKIKKEIKKNKEDVLGKSDVEEGPNATKAKEILGKIKTDDEKMGKVVKFAKFISDEANKDKIKEVEDLMTGGVNK